MKTERQIFVMIVSQPGSLQQILVNSLQGQPVSVIGVASGGLSAVAMLKGRQPDLLIVDANLPVEETLALLEHVRGKYPRVGTLALSETSQTLSAMRAAGADYVVLRYDLPRELPGVIESVQARPGETLGSVE